MQTSELILNLKKDLKPVERLLTPGLRLLAWGFLAYSSVLALVLLTGDLRPGFEIQISSSLRFGTEILLGLLSPLSIGYVALSFSIPGNQLKKTNILVCTLPALFLFGLLFYGLENPSLAPSMAGKREHCSLETWVFSVIPFLIFFFLGKRAAPLQPFTTGVLFGIAASIPPAIAMHVACMYVPIHVLQFHFAPILLVGAAGLISGIFLKN